MTTRSVQFRCPHCRARIKAPAKLMGHTRACPGCDEGFAVPRILLEDCGPVRVPIEEYDCYRLAFAYRRRVYTAFTSIPA
jgi:hypothetical protein